MKVTMNLTGKSYDIFIEKNILQTIGNYYNLNRKVMVITDRNVPKSYLNTVLEQLSDGYYYIIDGGETSKSLDSFEKIITHMLENNFTRGDLVIALGGGVIGDLSGFVASAYMRGIEYISIPTTTLSMIDSSIGGKTAVNFGKVKNMVGAFHHPSAVFIDINTLETLEKRHFYAGLVEAFKAGLIYDKEIYDLFLEENFEDKIEEIIYKSLLVKKDVVEQDEKEQNIRKILNFGHTIGHGIESYYDFSYYHGECVAMGLMFFLKNDKAYENCSKVFEKMGINVDIDFDIDTVFKLVQKDKKSKGKTITVVEVSTVGKAELKDITFDTLYAIMEEKFNAKS